MKCGRISFCANQPDVEPRAPSLLARWRGWEEAGGKPGLEERVGRGRELHLLLLKKKNVEWLCASTPEILVLSEKGILEIINYFISF